MKNTLTRLITTACILGGANMLISSSYANFDNNPPFYEQSQNYEDDNNLEIAQNITDNDLTTDSSAFAQIRDFFGMG